jgi:hypothetical protein
MRFRYHDNRRRELFPIWNQFTHAPRPITVNRAFHAFSRGELLDFPEPLSPWERKIRLGVDRLAWAYVRLITRWLAGETRMQDFTIAQLPRPEIQKAE